MKRAIVAAGIIAGLYGNTVLAAEFKVGTANLQKCFEEYYKTKSAELTLKEAADAYNKERQQLINEFQKLQEERQKLVDESNKPELSKQAKEDKTKEAEAKLAELRKQNESIQEFDRVRRQQLTDQQNRMRNSIVKEIADQVVRIAKVQNFTLVFDSSGSSMNGTPVLIYFEDRMDITTDIVRELNKNQPPPETRPAPPKTNEPSKSTAPPPAK